MLAEGYSPDDIILGGDSVGATLALMTLISVRDAGEKMPAGAFLLSPHSDLVHLDGYSYDSLADSDPTGSREGNQRILEDYLGGSNGEKPAILSPLRLYLHGLPHLYIQVGDQEVLLSDAERLADRARADGVEVTLEVWENMWSVFQFMAALLPEAQQAIMNIGNYTGESGEIQLTCLMTAITGSYINKRRSMSERTPVSTVPSKLRVFMATQKVGKAAISSTLEDSEVNLPSSMNSSWATSADIIAMGT